MGSQYRKLWFAIIMAVVFSATACKTVRSPQHGYKWIPVEQETDRLSEEQKKIVSSKGPPSAVWLKPFGVITWVYCIGGVPDMRITFDYHGALMGEGIGGDKGLCKRPPPEHIEGDETGE